MSSLIKLTVLLALIFALIPTSQGYNYSLYGIYKNTKKDLEDFCVRNPETCKQTQNAYNSAKEKIIYIGDAISYVVKHAAIDTAALDKETQAQSDDQNYERTNKDRKEDALLDGRNNTPKHDSTLRSEDLLDDWLPPDT